METLLESEIAFLEANREKIEQMAKGLFGGNVSLDERAIYQSIVNKTSRMSICWTCGGSVKRMANIILSR